MESNKSSSIEPEEIVRFSAQAEDFWNPEGAFRFLHKLETLRLTYIKDQISEHYNSPRDLKILDVGCGGGLVSEPLAKMGAEVTGLDASTEVIEIARKHAQKSKLKINYKAGSIEELANGTRFDVIVAMEIIEHVNNIDSFLSSISQLLKPNGLLIMSTINRTPRSFLLGIVAAEYLLGWIPSGTHDWEKFPRPSELVKKLENQGITTANLTGMAFNLFSGEFELKKGDLSVNYLLTSQKT